MDELRESPEPVVFAAGGVIWRRPADGPPEVLVVHRPRYDDWTFPKGKLDPGEESADGALREVEEETGLRCRLGPELPSSAYTDAAGRPKLVRYWAMTALSGSFEPNREVDAVRWVSLDAARDLLTYARDVAVLTSLETP